MAFFVDELKKVLAQASFVGLAYLAYIDPDVIANGRIKAGKLALPDDTALGLYGAFLIGQIYL